MNRITVVGTGGGSEEYMLPCAVRALENADYIIAAGRIADRLGLSGTYGFSTAEETVSLCRELMQKGSVCVCVSGDPLMYSFFKTLQNSIGSDALDVIPSVGAVQLMGARFKITLEDAYIISIHGRSAEDCEIVRAVREHKKVFFFCDKVHTPSYIAKILDENGLGGARMCVGADLTYENEVTSDITVCETVGREYSALAMAVVINKDAHALERGVMLSDSDFERTAAPMTKEEVRAVAMLKLAVGAGDTVWDIGAGTGSVSVECARSALYGEVYSVEKNAAALTALECNKNKFGLKNMKIISGNAANVIKLLPEPNAVFIGGTGGELEKIFKYILEIKKRIRVVITAVTLETKAASYELMKMLDDFDAVEINVSRAHSIGRYTVMQPNNSVMILSGCTKEKGLEV